MAVIALGVFLKFYQLEKKLFWDDEVATVLYTSGQKISDIKNSVPANQIKAVSYYDSLLHLKTKPYSVEAQIKGIFSDTHLTPAHYALLVLWYRIAGDNDVDYRLFSVFVFILSLPFLYLLVRDMIGSRLAALIATSLYAVSPFFNYKAQEARYYSLWLSLFIILNFCFLKAIRKNTAGWWIAYVVTGVVALYTSTLSAFFLMGHFIYLLYAQRTLLQKYLLFSLITALAYLPWMYFLYTVKGNIEQGLEWQKFNRPSFFTIDLLLAQVAGFIKSFVSYSNGYGSLFRGAVRSSFSEIPLVPLVVESFILLVIIYAFVHLLKIKGNTKAFLLLMFLPLVLTIYITDALRGAYTSFLWRYHVPNMAAVGLVVANLLYSRIEKGKFVFVGIYLALVGLGISSILKASESYCGDVRPDCPANVQEAQVISSAERPLVITDFGGWGFTNFLAVINFSKTKNIDILYIDGMVPDVQLRSAGKNYSDIFVVQSSPKLAQNIQEQFVPVMVAQRENAARNSPQFWRIRLNNARKVL